MFMKLKNIFESNLPFDSFEKVEKTIQNYKPGTFGVEFEIKVTTTESIKSEMDVETFNQYFSKYSRDRHRKFDYNYQSWLTTKREDLNRRWYGNLNRWDSTYGPVDPDTWESEVPQPNENLYSDNSEYEKALEDWNSTKNDVESEYKQWERRDQNDYVDIFIKEMLNDKNFDELLFDDSFIDNLYSKENIYETIASTLNFHGQKYNYTNEATETEWSLGDDGENIEIRTSHLKIEQKSFDIIRDVLSDLKNFETSGKTSAHIHIGLPENFNAFNLLCLSQLVDEKNILNYVDRGRDMSFTKLIEFFNKNFLKILDNVIFSKQQKKYIEVSIDDLQKIVRSAASLDKNIGTNLKAFWKFGTVEFRYFSSDIKKDPESFVKWIRYFGLLPTVAAKRSHVKIGGIVFSLKPGEKVGIEKKS